MRNQIILQLFNYSSFFETYNILYLQSLRVFDVFDNRNFDIVIRF